MRPLGFDGRVAVVTGAGRGVGREHALLLAARGASVVVNDVPDEGSTGPSVAESVQSEIRASGGEAMAVVGSVAVEEQARNLVDAAMERYGRIDIVINNAGAIDPKPFSATSIADFRKMIDVHYLGAVSVCLAAWPHMVQAGYGRIVNTVSTSILGEPTHAAYGGAKGALLGLTLNLAVEGAGSGIHVNAFAPSAVTRMASSSRNTGPNPTLDAGRRLLPPDRAVPPAAFLCHESCSITGQMWFCGGGRTTRYFIAETAGYANPAATAEDVASHLDEILDEDGYTVYRTMMDQVRYNLGVLEHCRSDVRDPTR